MLHIIPLRSLTPAPQEASMIWQPPLPRIYTQLSDSELRIRIQTARGRTRRPPAHSRAPLPARRDHRIRRFHRRQFRALPPGGRPAGRGVRHLLRRALHGRERRHPHPAPRAGSAARPRRGLLHGGHGQPRPNPRLLGAASRDLPRSADRPHHVHEQLRRHQSLRRRTRRRRMHQQQRAERAGVGDTRK